MVRGGNLSQKGPGVEPLGAVHQQETVRGGSRRRERVFFWRVGLKASETARSEGSAAGGGAQMNSTGLLTLLIISSFPLPQ